MKTLEQVAHELIVLYFDQDNRLLYIHSSEKKGDYADLAEAVGPRSPVAPRSIHPSGVRRSDSARRRCRSGSPAWPGHAAAWTWAWDQVIQPAWIMPSRAP